MDRKKTFSETRPSICVIKNKAIQCEKEAEDLIERYVLLHTPKEQQILVLTRIERSGRLRSTTEQDDKYI